MIQEVVPLLTLPRIRIARQRYIRDRMELYSRLWTIRSYLTCFLFLIEFRVDDKSRRRKEIKDDSSQFHLFYILYFSEKKKHIDVPVLLYSLYTLGRNAWQWVKNILFYNIIISCIICKTGNKLKRIILIWKNYETEKELKENLASLS